MCGKGEMTNLSSIFFSFEDIKDLFKIVLSLLFASILTGYFGITSQIKILLALAILFALIIAVYVGYGFSQVKNNQKEKSRTAVKETPRNIAIIYGKDFTVQTTYILPTESKDRVESIIKSHDQPESAYIKVDEKALSSVILNLFDKRQLAELGSVEIFQAFDILHKTFSKILFITDEFKKALVSSITWKYVGIPNKQDFRAFSASLNLSSSESQLFGELSGLSENDRVVGLILPKIGDLEDMDLSVKEKMKIFDRFYNGLRKIALVQHIDNLGESNMFFIGKEEKEPREVIEDDIKVIKDIKLKLPESEIILEARGSYTNLAAQIAGTLLGEVNSEFEMGRVAITTHEYPDGSEQPKIWLTLLKKGKANKKELKYYDELEKKTFVRIRELQEKTTCVEKDEPYDKIKVTRCIEKKGEIAIVAEPWGVKSRLFHVLNTLKYFVNVKKRILKVDCVISHTSNPMMYILVSDIGFFSDT